MFYPFVVSGVDVSTGLVLSFVRGGSWDGIVFKSCPHPLSLSLFFLSSARFSHTYFYLFAPAANFFLHKYQLVSICFAIDEAHNRTYDLPKHILTNHVLAQSPRR